MTQVTTKDYWISPSALHIELNALGNPDYIQASCVSGAQILVYVKDIIGYDAGHNYRRWPLQAAPTVFNSHTEKYVYAAIPRDMTLVAAAWIVFPSELLDIYGKNEKEEQIGNEKYYYIDLQGIITSSGENGTEQRDWNQRVSTGYLSSDEATSAIGGETEWYKYSSEYEIVTFLKDLTMKEGTTFRTLFANFINVQPKGSLSFEGQGALNGIANSSATPDNDATKIVTPNFVSARAISRLHDDTAQGIVTFLNGLKVGNYLSGAQGGFIDSQANAELLSIIVRKLISSANYKSGFDGEGYRLWIDEEGLSNLELDRLTVRQIMTVFELIIDRIRSVGGQIVVSAANGKIKAVEDTGEAYKITFEGDNYFQAHDLMRCQVFKGEEIRGYWVEVAASYSDYIVVAKSEFSGTITVGDKKLIITEPKEGDEVVLMGNTANNKRQKLISISATEDGEPRVDVLDGVKAKNFNGALRVRLGNLDGIADTSFPLNAQPHGNGLYADNAYLKGTFLLETGEDVRTKFEVTEGRIESAVEGVRRDLGGGHLSNATFGDGMAKWDTQNEAVFFLAGNRWVWANGGALSKKGDFASVTKDMGRTVVQIRNRYIRQRGENLQDVPSFQTGADGRKIPVSVHLSFFYRCSSAGVLRVGFENVDKRGFADFESMSVEERLEATDGYRQYTCGGLWNGTGDFRLSFTGEIYLHMLILSTDKAESLVYKYRTLFEQSEKLVRIAAQNFDKDGRVLSESGIMVKPEGSGIYVQGPDGKLALIGVAVEEADADGNTHTVIKLTADNIQLEGLVTANGNFKILEDGSIEAMNGKFGGEVNATSGKIGGFAIGDGHIGADYTGGAPGADTAAGLFMRNDMLGFNAAGRQALMGTVSENGMPLLLRLTDTARDTLPRTALGVSVTGSVTDNIALDIDGGHVRGLAVRTRVIGLDRVSSPTAPSSLSVTLGREECAVYVTTRYYWSGSPTGTYASRERDVSVTLPVMRSCDDGHVVKIKRGTGGGTVRIVAGGCVISSLTSAGGYADTEGRTLIIADGSAGVAELTLDSPGDAMELVWFRDIGMTVDGTARKGAWVQWKNPRDW